MTRTKPDVEHTIDRLSDTWDTARIKLRTDVVPAVVSAAESARESSAPVRAEAKERAAAALLALRGEPVKKVRRWPVALLCLIAGAGLGAVAAMTRRVQLPTVGAPAMPFPRPQDPVADGQSPSATRSGTTSSSG